MTKDLTHKQIAFGLYQAYTQNGMSQPDSKERLVSVLFLAPATYTLEFVDQILTEIERGEGASPCSPVA